MKLAVTVICALAALACGSSNPEPAEKKQSRPAEKIVDQTRRFPKDGLVASRTVETNLAGKDFMPGGNFADYEAGGKKYQMFFTQRPDGDKALYLFMDYKDILKDAKFIAHLGGYYGDDDGVPTLVFQKANYVIGITGLDEKAADTAARTMAAYLN